LGGLEAVFREKQTNLEKIPNVGPILARHLKTVLLFQKRNRSWLSFKKTTFLVYPIGEIITQKN